MKQRPIEIATQSRHSRCVSLPRCRVLPLLGSLYFVLNKGVRWFPAGAPRSPSVRWYGKRNDSNQRTRSRSHTRSGH
jgi:hypothetical protein